MSKTKLTKDFQDDFFKHVELMLDVAKFAKMAKEEHEAGNDKKANILLKKAEKILEKANSLISR